MEKHFSCHWEGEMNNIKIEVLSPIHIGDNENKNLSSLSDFIFEDGHIKMIDHAKVENIFSENPQIMEDYIREVKAYSGKEYNLSRFLKECKIKIQEVTSDEIIPVIGEFNAKEIHPFISENGRRYIPGSSLKGAIRNSLAFVYLKAHPKMIEKITRNHSKPNSNPNFSWEEKQIFGKNQFNDILKFLEISDSSPFPGKTSAVYASRNYHLTKQEIETTIPLNYECVIPNSKTKVRVKIKDNIPFDILDIADKDFWKEHLTIHKIFEALNTLSTRFIEREVEELRAIKNMQATVVFYNKLLDKIKKSNNQTAYLCIGKGTTIMGKTILLVLDKEQLHNLRNTMKKTKAARNFGWKRISRNDQKEIVASKKLPVTRLIYKNQGNWLACFGWMKITNF